MRKCATPDCTNRTSDPNHPSRLCAICRRRREAQFAAEDALGDAFDQRKDDRRCSGCGVPEGYLHSKDCPLAPAFDDLDAPGKGECLGGLHYPPGAEELTLGRKDDAIKPRGKYCREISAGVWVDVYDVLAAWGVDNPALQHLIKKALQPGQRGHKTREQDLDDIIDSAYRAKELES